MIQTHQVKKTIIAALLSNAVVLDVEGFSTIAFDITGTFVGTLIFEYTINGTDWYTLTVNALGTNTPATGTTAVGKWNANVSGFMKVRIRCTAFTSGPILVAARTIATGFAGASGSAGAGSDSNSSVTGLAQGKKTVTTAGTDVVLAASTPAKKVLIQAYRANTGYISVGAAGTDATNTNGDSIQLAAGESVLIPCSDLANIFIDATVSGEGVRYTYFT